MQSRVLFCAAACLSLAACFEGPVTFQVPPLSGPLVSVTTGAAGAAGAAAPAMTAAGSSAPRTVARTVAPQTDAMTADDVDAVDDAGVDADTGAGGAGGAAAGGMGGSSATGAAGAGHWVAIGAGGPSAPVAGAGGAGGSSAEPDYPVTRCQLVDRIVDCRATLLWHPDWNLSWFVGHAISDGVSGVSYGCRDRGAPTCVRGAECSFSVIGSGQPLAFGVCL